MIAVLALEDGTWYQGVSAGAAGQTEGEVVFNTSMSGYQEVLTDPSYAGQIVTMTAPQIGNYGVAETDVESEKPQVAGFVMRDPSPVSSNWRSQGTLRDYLTRNQIVAIGDIDTRALTRKLRSGGVMRGIIATGSVDPAVLVEQARLIPNMEGSDLVKDVTCAEAYDFETSLADTVTEASYGVPPLRRAKRTLRVAAYDYGIKTNILRRLAAHGCKVRVFPASTPAAELLAWKPDGIFLSNGPGDPAAVTYAIDNIKEIAKSDVPTFGICLGHQLMGLALGAKTYKLKFGHRGGNHPVKQLETGAIEITSQNHGFSVDPETLPSTVKVTHLNLYDGTVEGLRHINKPIFSVQYHPEASPGPHDADYLFEEFLTEMEKA
ncbi:MAG: glutamine-hydrolyzing carbamoyl-phosphate synthase small subunit [Vicinamibacterales bacterium]